MVPRTVFDQRRCLDLLERLLAQPPLPDDAPFDRWERGDLLRAVAANAHHQDVNLGDLTWPGVPPGEPAFRDPWNVGRIRQGIAALAAAAGQPPEMLLADTVAEIRSRIEAALPPPPAAMKPQNCETNPPAPVEHHRAEGARGAWSAHRL